MLNKKLLIAGMATAAIVAPTAALAADTSPTKQENYVETINANGEKVYVDILSLNVYISERGYSLTETGKAELEEAAKNLPAADNLNKLIVEMKDKEGNIHYSHVDYIFDKVEELGYELTPDGEAVFKENYPDDEVPKPPTSTPDTDEPTTEVPETPTPETDEPVENPEPPTSEVDEPTEVPDTEDPETDEPTTEDPDTSTPDTDEPVVETPDTEDPDTSTPDEDNPADEDPSGSDSSDDEDEEIGVGDSIGNDNAPPVDSSSEIVEVDGEVPITTVKIQDFVITSGGPQIVLDLNNHFISKTGTLAYQVSVQSEGGLGDGFVSIEDGNKLVIDPAEVVAKKGTAILVVKATNVSGYTETLTFKVSMGENGAGTLPQTGSAESGLGVLIGALMVAGAVVAGRRNKN